MAKKSNRTPITILIAVVALTGIFGFAFLASGQGLVLGNVSSLQLTENFRDLNCDAWNELAVTKDGQTSVVGSGRQGFTPSFQSASLLSVTDGSSEVDFMHVRLILNCDGSFMKNPATVQGSMDFQLCGDPQGATTTCFAGNDRFFTQLEGVAVSTSTFFNVPIQQQTIPDDEPVIIWEGDISAFELERLFSEGDGKIQFKSIMFPNLIWTFNSPTLGIFTAQYNSITANDPIISQYGELRVIDETTDTDGDGFIDSEDGCINQAEIFNGFQDDDGCPDELPPETDDVTQETPTDSDGDGVVDGIDLCPTVAGTVANIGCPDPVVEEDETREIGTTEIPPPLFEQTQQPTTQPTIITVPIMAGDENRTLVIIGLLIAGFIAIIIVGLVQKMRK